MSDVEIQIRKISNGYTVTHWNSMRVYVFHEWAHVIGHLTQTPLGEHKLGTVKPLEKL